MQYNKTNTLLKVSNLNFSYGTKRIVKDVSFEIKDIIRPDIIQGQIVSLIGRSGIGKTTIFKLLAGLLTPNSGTVESSKGPINPGEMGIVPQNYLLFNHRTVKKNLLLAANKNRVFQSFYSKSTVEAAIQQYCTKFDIIDQLNKYPLELSGGQRQRVSIIQQLLNGSDFILLDEPFSGLDRIVKKEVMNVLSAVSLLSEVKTLIIVSHDFESSVAISDTAVVLASDPNDPGAYVRLIVDMAERGLAWQSPDMLRSDPRFIATIKEIEEVL